MAEEKTEGWQSEAKQGQRVFHYIRNTFSLCRKLGFYFGGVTPAVPGAARNREDCAACYKLLAKEGAHGGS